MLQRVAGLVVEGILLHSRCPSPAGRHLSRISTRRVGDAASVLFGDISKLRADLVQIQSGLAMGDSTFSVACMVCVVANGARFARLAASVSANPPPLTHHR